MRSLELGGDGRIGQLAVAPCRRSIRFLPAMQGRVSMRSPPQADGPSLSCRAHSTSAMPSGSNKPPARTHRSACRCTWGEGPRGFRCSRRCSSRSLPAQRPPAVRAPAAAGPRNATSAVPVRRIGVGHVLVPGARADRYLTLINLQANANIAK
jgi:hypothetical protein